MAGTSDNGSNGDLAFARYYQDGTLDAVFGIAGKLTTPLDYYSNDEARAIAIQPDGKIIAGGISNYWAVLVRYNSNGDLDESFGMSGVVQDYSYPAVHALVLQPDGKIVVAGFADDGLNYDFAIARYNSNGSLDGSFGTDGMLTTDFGSNWEKAVGILQVFDLLVVGDADNNSTGSAGKWRCRFHRSYSFYSRLGMDSARSEQKNERCKHPFHYKSA